MLNEEIRKHLTEHHEEEMKDYESYCELRDTLRNDGYYHEAGMIHDIAEEEKMHARILKEILDRTSH